MAKPLTTEINTQINSQQLKPVRIFKINNVDRSSYLISSDIKFDRTYGSASATFVLSNVGGVFGDGGGFQIYVGDVIQYQEKFEGDSTVFDKFYGRVEQRSIDKSATSREITLNCLDEISLLQKVDIDLEVEGTKVKIEEETLEPNYLPAPNENMAQVFNFANNGLAQEPPPIITIRPQATTTLVGESPQYDGFQILYAQGQLMLGTPLNALDNYDVVSTAYYFYTQGVFVEDIIQTILTEPDGYGNYLFGEASAQDVIDNHLITSFYDEQGSNIDYLVPNYTDSDIDIKTQMTSAYYTNESGYDPTVLNVEDTSGFPSSGTASVNGDIFTYTGKTATTLTGVSGLSDKPDESYVKYDATYTAGQVWYLRFSNITDTLSSGNISGLPSGVSVEYIDHRYGRIILSSAIDLNTILSHTVNYNFKTLQATGVELNKISFRTREVNNRFDAIAKLREYLAPNYVIRTKGDSKIWSSYLSQKVEADYTLKLAQKIDYLEDEDLYTRVVFHGKNSNPTNIMYNDGIQFVDSGQEFKATAAQSELQFEREEGNNLIYKSTISDAGRIDTSIIKPIVYINNVPVNDKPAIISLMPVVVAVTQRTETITQEKRSGSPDISIRQYFYYKIRFAHTSIDPTQNIVLYDAVGLPLVTITPGSSGMDYASGVYNVPGTSQNGTIEQVSTASYTVFYSTAGITIEPDTVRFTISKQLIPTREFAVVAATFQYWTAITPFDSVGSIIDGRFDTQVQTEFYAEPPNGLPYAILDLGQEYEIQAIDFIAGFYRPDEIRKFDVNFSVSLMYSNDNIDYHYISPETQNIAFTGGSSKKFEEKDLGVGFTARYLRLNIEEVKRLENKVRLTITEANDPVNVWVVAFTEVAAYDNIILKGEARLTPTTELTSSVVVESLDSSGSYPTTINVLDTTGFEEPESGQTATAYIEEDSFTYTGLTSTSFVGVQGLSIDHANGARVSQELESDTVMYDTKYLLPKLKDRLYKENRVSDDLLFTQTQLNRVAMAFLQEFYKNHDKIKTDVVFAPYLSVGDTISVTDTYNGLDEELYFIESIGCTDGFYNLVLARYSD